MAAKRNFEIVKGDDYAHVVTITDANGPINITGRTYTSQLRRIASQAAIDATFTCTVTNGPAGEVTLYLADTVTDTLLGEYKWDFQEDASGTITTLLVGKVTVKQDVTR